jgi:hypothetical protein
MTSIQFVVHPLPGTQEQLQEKLREVADRLNKYNTSGTPRRIFNGPDPDRIRIQERLDFLFGELDASSVV